MANKSLHDAKKNKNDEFYTQLSDIEKELKHYKEHFENKVVFCNCDDPKESNFWQYFSLNFDYLKIKRLLATHYDTEQKSYMLEMYRDENGDFRSPECIELLKQSDIVVTNPPFSLFREYVAQLMDYNKKFIIIGNKNAITYKEIFPLIKDDKVWLGFNVSNGTMYFKTLDSEELKGIPSYWYTNLDTRKRHEELILYKTYNKNEYPKYDNYDAINVDKIKDIPMDYNGVMGVPITFMDRYCPEQFEILGITSGRNEFDKLAWPIKHYENAKQINSNGSITNGSKMNTRATLIIEDKNFNKTYYIADNSSNHLQIVYARILIKRKDSDK